MAERPLLLSREVEGQDHEGESERWVLEDSEISRRHALLSPLSDDEWELHDAGSHNGTYLNGERIERARVTPGDIIRVGQHILLFQYLDVPATRRLTRRRPPDSPLIGEGPACKLIDEQLSSCAGEPGPVLVLGESGTGKELVAQQLHVLSRRTGPLVTVNCTTLTESVADSELFGHLSGAFSGATRNRDGLFAAANGGTLFLDELGDMPLALQAKLLRTIETGEVRSVGSNRTVQVDTRVVAATNVDLAAAARNGTFRGDLLARLQRMVIHLPPLRERRDDVLLLARHFMHVAGGKMVLTPDAAEALAAHDWPYNVRELRNVIESAVRAARGRRTLDSTDLPPELTQRLEGRSEKGADVPLGRAPENADELREILTRNAWNVTKVAALFGRDRKQIYRWCTSFGVDVRARR